MDTDPTHIFSAIGSFYLLMLLVGAGGAVFGAWIMFLVGKGLIETWHEQDRITKFQVKPSLPPTRFDELREARTTDSNRR